MRNNSASFIGIAIGIGVAIVFSPSDEFFDPDPEEKKRARVRRGRRSVCGSAAARLSFQASARPPQ